MKKLCLVLGLAGLLSMPSIVFGEATWYGSFRGGVESAGGSSHMFSNGSRWGVKGSNEISEGLTANYRYEEALDLATASLSTGNRLSYVGLSGGFGTISIGRIWSASFNSVGAILDNSWVYGSSHTSYRVGPAVSYSNSAGAASLQVDLVMDGNNAAKSGVDSYEFGLSFDLGAATLAFAHRKRNHAAMSTTTTEFVPGTAGTPTMVVVTPGNGGTPTQVEVTPGTGGTPTQVEVTPGTGSTPTGTGTPTMVTVTPAVVGVTGADAILLGSAIRSLPTRLEQVTVVEDDDDTVETIDDTTKATAIPTGNIIDVSSQTIVELRPRDCRDAGGIWYDWDGDGNDGSAACYKSTDAVKMRVVNNVFQKAQADETEVEPLADVADKAACDAMDNSQWEPITGACYRATVPTTAGDGTTPVVFTYIKKAAVEKVEEQPIKVEVEPGTAGTAGTAGTPTQVEVTPGTAGTPTTVEVTPGTAGTATTVEVTPGTPGTPSTMVTTTTTTPAYDDTMNAVAVRFAAGSHSAAVGLVKTSNSMGGESSTTIANAGGPLSDGLSYNFMVRDTEGTGSNPWLIGLAKSLGGGSTVVLEHADNGDDNSTAVYLQVDF